MAAGCEYQASVTRGHYVIGTVRVGFQKGFTKALQKGFSTNFYEAFPKSFLKRLWRRFDVTDALQIYVLLPHFRNKLFVEKPF
jgi:hypothetical protein